MEPGDLGVEPETDVRSDPRRVAPDQGCAGPTRDAVCLIDVTKGDQGRAPEDADPAAFGATPRRSLHCRGPETRVRRAASRARSHPRLRGWLLSGSGVMDPGLGSVPQAVCDDVRGA